MRKYGILMLLTGVLWACCTRAYAQDDMKLSMTFNEEQLTEVLNKLAKNSSYKFLYDYEDVDKYRVNGKVVNEPVLEIVKYILCETGLNYKVEGMFVNITPAQKTASKKPGMKNVGGYVLDKETGEPLISAQVRVLGTNVAAVTDLDGAFAFNHYLGGSHKLQVSCVGMRTLEMPVRQFMKIELVPDAKVINEVVVTGIFQKAKESYTGAVTTIDKEKLQVYRGTNLLQTLKNIDASINIPVNNLAGSNPNVLPNLNIRGSSSLPMSVEELNQNVQQTVNAPLIIMDGFEISLAKLMDYNDEQIESINILKDASATAIYGSRGANGVIVIVTKTPKEGKLRVSLKTGLSLEVPDLSSYRLLNAAQKLQLEKQVGLYSAPTNPMTQTGLDEYYNERLKTVLDGTDTDWMAKPLRNGVGQTYNLQMDGGANEFRWGASLGYNDVQGAMKGSSRKNLTGDMTLMYSIKNLTFRNYVSITSNHANESKYGSFQNFVDMNPYNTPYDENGNLV